MQEEIFVCQAIKFSHAPFRKGPERFDAVDVIFTPGKFVLVVENAVVIIAVQDEPVISFPAISIDRRTFEDFALNDRHKLAFGAVFDHLNMHISASLKDPKNRGFSSRSPTSFAHRCRKFKK
jgi:hypothetical protein